MSTTASKNKKPNVEGKKPGVPGSKNEQVLFNQLSLNALGIPLYEY